MTTLEESFERCRRLTRASGTTYYWSTALLPAVKRPYVHALYAFCRYADDIVDSPQAAGAPDRATALAAFGDRFLDDLARGHSDDPVCRAVVHTARAFQLPAEPFRRFLRSMTMDLTVAAYDTYADLEVYMDGSAAVIGELMIPILEPVAPEAFAHARQLGVAFQLTNFLRDIAEDADRGRTYVPQEDIARFGAEGAFAARTVTPAFVDLLRFEIDRTRALYADADVGIGLLRGRAQRGILASRALYAGILDRIEAAGYDVWAGRVRVPAWRKVTAGLGAARP